LEGSEDASYGELLRESLIREGNMQPRRAESMQDMRLNNAILDGK
jgi:hypothetical protein